MLEASQPPTGDNTGSEPAAITNTVHGRPEAIRSVPTLSDISFEPAVVSTNLLLAIITLIALIASATIVNTTMEENDRDLRYLTGKITKPFKAFVKSDANPLGLLGGSNLLNIFIPPLLALSAAAFIYGIGDPNFGFNEPTLVLFFSYLIAFMLVVYAYDGIQLLLSRRYGVSAAIKVFPLGVVVALICVALSRVTGFVPGLMYGFVAAHTLTGSTRLRDDQQAKEVLYPSLFLLLFCTAAWMLAGPLRDLAESNDTAWAALPEGVAIGIFASGLQSLFFQLIPIRFMDGHHLWNWNKWLWFPLALGSAFLFWEVLVNANSDSVEALSTTPTAVALAIIIGSLGVASLFYLAMRVYNAPLSFVEVPVEAD